MRRALVILGVTGILGVAACGGSGGGTGSGDGTTNPTVATVPTGSGNSVTDPIDRAKTVVGQQNDQLQQEEQQTGQEDPTSP